MILYLLINKCIWYFFEGGNFTVCEMQSIQEETEVLFIKQIE